MTTPCPECGATIADGGSCQDHFNALLILESEIPGGPGEEAHFYAVASYALQHPDSMSYTAEALYQLLANVRALLQGQTTLEAIRRSTRRATNGATRVIRRDEELGVPWHRGLWPITVVDVLTVEVNRDAYAETVKRWASSVYDALQANGIRAST